MTPTRREFLVQTSALAIPLAAEGGSIQAIAFDAFPILDPRPVFKLVDELYPEKGADLGNLWRTRQFEYTWLRTLSRRYADFWQVTEESLTYAAKTLKLQLSADNRDRLMQAYLQLKCWPDVPDALQSLKKAGLRVAFLSNMTAKMLEAGLHNSQLERTFDLILSTDRVQAFKPDPRAYQMGLDVLQLKRDQILFAAFAGWDAAGAKAFGYPTYWVNRQNQPAEELGAAPDATGKSLTDLVTWLNSR